MSQSLERLLVRSIGDNCDNLDLGLASEVCVCGGGMGGMGGCYLVGLSP